MPLDIKHQNRLHKFITIFAIVYAIAVLAGLILYLSNALSLSAIFLGLLLAILPIPLWTTGILILDRKEKEPLWMKLATFVWGASVAILFSLVFNTLLGAVTGGWTSQLIAPVVEETAKAAILFLFFFFLKKEFNGILDGLVYAGLVGLGFAMVENIVYYAREISTDGFSGGLRLFYLRGLLSAYAHPLFTAATGVGLGIASVTKSEWLKKWMPLIGLGCAILLHSLWNSSGIIGSGGFWLIYLLVFIPVFILIVASVWLGFFSPQQEDTTNDK